MSEQRAREYRIAHLTEFPYQLGTTDDGTYMQCATTAVDDLMARFAASEVAEAVKRVEIKSGSVEPWLSDGLLQRTQAAESALATEQAKVRELAEALASIQNRTYHFRDDFRLKCIGEIADAALARKETP